MAGRGLISPKEPAEAMVYTMVDRRYTCMPLGAEPKALTAWGPAVRHTDRRDGVKKNAEGPKRPRSIYLCMK